MTDLTIDSLYDGRYRIRRQVGSGGMADVYLAEDETLGRPVAIKVLNARHARDEQFVTRFLREASSAARLNHPNIVQVYDRGESDGTYYIAMEFVDGSTLKEIITARGPLPTEQVFEYAGQALNALRFAHRNGVVHRDVKPHNMMIDADGRLKIADFGIARAGTDQQLTEVGSIVGTAQYLSPEQARGETVSAASDLYSLGVVMFEMLTGRVPFEGDSPVNVALQHVNNQVPRPSEFRPGVSPELEAVTLRALQKDPASRYQSADEFLADLERARGGKVSSETAAMTAVLPGSERTTVAAGAAMHTQMQPPPARTTTLPAATAASSYAYNPVDEHPGGYGEEDERDQRRSPLRWILPLLILLLLGAGAAWALTSGDGSDDRTTETTAAAETVRLPDLTGMPVSEARDTLLNLDLKVGTTTQRASDEVAEGLVISTNPERGTDLEAGESVDLIVSSGPDKVEVPDVVGKTRAQAQQQIEDAGLRFQPEEAPSDEVAQGIVISTSPAAGTQQVPGKIILVTISSGPEQVTVPTVTEQPVEDATSELEDAGFVVETQEIASVEPAGTVLTQNPAGGTQAAKGSTVRLQVASGNTPVPDVLGQTYDSAKNELEQLGFSVTREIKDYNDPTLGPQGTVQVQSPEAGDEAPQGSTVNVEVWRHRPAAPPPPTQPV